MEANQVWEEQREVQLININNKEGHLIVTSREVADNFEKRHSDVLEKVDSLIKEMDSTEKSVQYFIEDSYKDNSGKKNREYLLTRDGFSLLVMGFTGAKALQWKVKYIEAFNKMEQELKNTRKVKLLSPREQMKLQLEILEEQDKKIESVEKKVDDLESNLPLFNIECDELQKAVRKKGIEVLGGYKSVAYEDKSLRTRVYADIQSQVKREFGLGSYKAIKRSQLDIAKSLIEGYKAPLVLQDEITCLNRQISI